MKINKIPAIAGVLFSLGIILASCAGAPPEVPTVQTSPQSSVAAHWALSEVTVDRIVDKETNVVCYISDGLNSGGIFCLQMSDLVVNRLP